MALLALVLVGTGCPSFATRGSARTLKAGEWEVEAGLGAMNSHPLAGPSSGGYNGKFDSGDLDEFTGNDTYALMELGVGMGLTDGFELGGRLMLPGGGNPYEKMRTALAPALALDTKLQLTREDEQGHGLDMAIDPTVTVAINPDDGAKGLTSYVQLPLLLGVSLSERHQFVFSPQLTVVMPHLGLTGRQLIPSVGVAYLHRRESGWTLRPELTVIAPPDLEGHPFDTATFQVGVSMLKR